MKQIYVVVNSWQRYQLIISILTSSNITKGERRTSRQGDERSFHYKSELGRCDKDQFYGTVYKLSLNVKSTLLPSSFRSLFALKRSSLSLLFVFLALLLMPLEGYFYLEGGRLVKKRIGKVLIHFHAWIKSDKDFSLEVICKWTKRTNTRHRILNFCLNIILGSPCCVGSSLGYWK